MNDTDAAAPPLCVRCGRPLRSERAQRIGYGPECWSAILAASERVDLSAWTVGQVTNALELIRDGGMVLIRDRDSFAYRSTASDGTTFYLTVTSACSCPAGQRENLCYHRAAVKILLASRDTARSQHRDYGKRVSK